MKKNDEKYQIFISYRRREAGYLAHLIHDRLEKENYNVFFDVDSLETGRFDKQLFSIIDSCEIVIVLLSPNSLDERAGEDWVRKEIQYSIEHKKIIIPVIQQGFVFPEGLPKPLCDIHLMEGVKADVELFDGTIVKLLRLIGKNLDNNCEKKLERLKSAIKQADQEVFWNVSEDIYEEAAFFIDEDQRIIFHSINTGYKLENILDIRVHVGNREDDSNISIIFSNGDMLTVGSIDYRKIMTLMNVNKNLFLVNQQEIETYFQNTVDQSIVKHQMIISGKELLEKWRYCCIRTKMTKHVCDLSYNDQEFLIINGIESDITIDDVRSIVYYNRSGDCDDFEQGIILNTSQLVIMFVEDAYSGYRIFKYPVCTR